MRFLNRGAAERFFDQFPADTPVTIEIHRNDWENSLRVVNTTAEYGAKAVHWYTRRRVTKEVTVQVPGIEEFSIRGPMR